MGKKKRKAKNHKRIAIRKAERSPITNKPYTEKDESELNNSAKYFKDLEDEMREIKTQNDFLKFAQRKYKGDCDILPMPTLIDAVNQNIKESLPVLNEGLKRALDFIRTWEPKLLQDKQKKIKFSQNAVLFYFPLDFFIPLPKYYTSVILSSTGEEGDYFDEFCSITSVEDNIRVGAGRMKITWLLVVLSNHRIIELFNDPEDQEGLYEEYEKAIRASNSVIGSFQAIPNRHNHYMHFLTVMSAQMRVAYQFFNWRNGEVLHKGQFVLNKNPESDIMQSIPLRYQELENFQILQTGWMIDNDPVYVLVSKANQSVSMYCMGFYDDAVLLSANFVEHSVGYVFYLLKKANGENDQEAAESYLRISKSPTQQQDNSNRASGETVTIWGELASMLGGVSVKTIKKNIGFSQWYTKCQLKRNDLVHRFLYDQISRKDAGEALLASFTLINRLCELVMQKYDDVELRRKLTLLKSISVVPESFLKKH